MKIVFMGTPSYATAILKKLLQSGFEVIAIFTQPDKPVGRKQILTPPDVKQFCIDNDLSIEIFQPQKLRDEYNYEILKNLKPDFIIVAAYGQILPANILKLAPCINLHASILPTYRGASPIHESILNNDNFTGVTSMLMDEGLDTGDILAVKYLQINKDDDIETLFEKLSNLAAILACETVSSFEIISPLKQNVANASHCRKIKKEFGLINFNDSKEIISKSKAYKIWPGIFLDSGLKLKEIAIKSNNTSNVAGEILEIRDDCIVVGCVVGEIFVFHVQPASKQQMKAIDYIRGKRLKVGDILS